MNAGPMAPIPNGKADATYAAALSQISVTPSCIHMGADTQSIAQPIWTGREASLLRVALRMTHVAYAEHLGVAERTVSAWRERGQDVRLRPDMQETLDTALSQASNEARERFLQLRDGKQGGSPGEPALQVHGDGAGASGRSGRGAPGTRWPGSNLQDRPRSPDRVADEAIQSALEDLQDRVCAALRDGADPDRLAALVEPRMREITRGLAATGRVLVGHDAQSGTRLQVHQSPAVLHGTPKRRCR